MTVQKIIPCICCADDYEEMSLNDSFYGMPYLTVHNSLKDHQQFWTYWCPKCGVGGKFLEFGSQYLALKDWNELQTSLRTDPWKYVEVIDDGESGS